MSAQQGYFCLVQYCPDRRRMEAVNVGVVLYCPALDHLEVRVTDNDARAARFFGPDGVRLDLLRSGTLAIVNRLRSDAYRPHSLEELQHFVDTRGNNLILTPPRPVRVEDPSRELDDLFRELVLDPSPARPAPVAPTAANGAAHADAARAEAR
jgi:Protein of unknown function (DUF3037)